MGKRRRNQDSSKQKGKRPGDKQVVAERPPQNGPSADIDADCVLYHSGSEHDIANSPSMSGAEDGSETSEEEHDSEQELVIGDTVDDESDVELSVEFFDPSSADVSSIQNFLKKLEHRVPTKKTSLSSRQLAEAVCSQTRVGTTIRVTNDDTPIGFISCLNMRDHRKLLKPLIKHLTRLCEASKEFEKFSSLLKTTTEGTARFERERMGLILCERVLNFPPLLVPKLLEALFCEIEWAVEDEPTEKERDSFRLGWYLYITEVYYTKEKDSRTGDEKEAKKKRRKESGEDEQISFARVEDEAWLKHATSTLTWNVPVDSMDKTEIKRRQMAMLINSKKIEAVRNMVSDLVGIKEMDVDAKQENDGSGNADK